MRLIPSKQAEAPGRQVRIPAFDAGVRTVEHRVLDFDVETVAAGFADPDWVPQKITCVAWSWIDEPHIESGVCGPLGLFGNPALRQKMLIPLLDAIREADMVTGHNIERFDLPVINAECMRLDLTPLDGVLVQDTMRVYRSKGFKKGQDNLGTLYGAHGDKLALTWQQWQDAYDEKDWATIRERAESDVLMHVELRDLMIARGVLKPPRIWRAS
jgi:DNA polymerase elongation subunit (family B)